MSLKLAKKTSSSEEAARARGDYRNYLASGPLRPLCPLRFLYFPHFLLLELAPVERPGFAAHRIQGAFGLLGALVVA